MALGLCTSLVPLQAQLLPAHSREPSALALLLVSSGAAFLHSHLLGWIGSVSVYKLHTGMKVQVLALLLWRTIVTLGQECNEGSLESIPFHCWEEGTYRGKAMRGCLGDHSNPFPISTLGF